MFDIAFYHCHLCVYISTFYHECLIVMIIECPTSLKTVSFFFLLLFSLLFFCSPYTLLSESHSLPSVYRTSFSLSFSLSLFLSFSHSLSLSLSLFLSLSLSFCLSPSLLSPSLSSLSLTLFSHSLNLSLSLPLLSLSLYPFRFLLSTLGKEYLIFSSIQMIS